MKKNILHFITLIGLLLAIGCTEENDVFEEPLRSEESVFETNLFLDFLFQEYIIADTPSNCLQLEYPITLLTNTNNNIIIENINGLGDVTETLNTGFYITGVVFPLTINNTEVNTLLDLKNTLKDCSVNPFTDFLNANILSCFTYLYPISLINDEGNSQFITSPESYVNFLDQQGDDYELQIDYPVIIATTLNQSRIDNNFHFYSTLFEQCTNTIVRCTTVNNFTINSDLPSLAGDPFAFFDVSSSQSIEEVRWFVNDELQQGADSPVLVTGKLNKGELHEICAEVRFPDCKNFKRECITVTPPLPGEDDVFIGGTSIIQIAETSVLCNQIEIITEASTLFGTYDFFVNQDFADSFPDGIPTVRDRFYRWVIDGEIIQNNPGFFLTNIFTEAGIHEICVEAIGTRCERQQATCISITLTEGELLIATP